MMPGVDQPEGEHHWHDGHPVPVLGLYVSQSDEEPRFHHHDGVDVPVVALYAVPNAGATGRVPDLDLTKEMGVLCPVCEFTPSPELEAYQLQHIMGMYHFEDHGD